MLKNNNLDCGRLRKECNELLKTLEYKTNLTDDQKEDLRIKYHYINDASKGLFDFILRNKSSSLFDKITFDKHLNLMLDKFSNVRDVKTTQDKASEEIGSVIFNKYIPANLRQ